MMIRTGWIILGSFFLVTGCSLRPDSTVFSADLVATVDGVTSQSRVFIGGDKFKIEAQSARRSSVMIARFDKEILWVLIPSLMQYKEFPLSSMGDQFPPFLLPGTTVALQKLGTDTVEGVSAVKYKAHVIGRLRTYDGYLWESVALSGFPLKWQDSVSGATAVWKNSKLLKLPPSTFELPEGYTSLPELKEERKHCRNHGSD